MQYFSKDEEENYIYVCTATGVHFRSTDLHRKICVLHYVTEWKTSGVAPQSKPRPYSVRGLIRYTMAHFEDVKKYSRLRICYSNYCATKS